jgi:periplasmic protein TonB
LSLEAVGEPPSDPVTPTPVSTPPPISQPTPEPLPAETPIPPKADDFIAAVASKATPTPPPLPTPSVAPTSSENFHPKLPAHSPSPNRDLKGPATHSEKVASRLGGAGNGKATYLDNPEPPYPEEAREAQIQGRLELMVSVDETGRVTSVRLLKSSGDLSLDQSALRTVRTRWKFRPAQSAGAPVSSEIQVPITFRLTE